MAILKRLSYVSAALVLSVAQTAYAQTVKTSFSNNTPATIPASGQASTYPITITTSGLTGAVYHVTVALNLSHTFPADLDILLVSPNGRSVMLTSDGGGNGVLTNSIVTFDDCATRAVGSSGSLAGGRFRPTNIGSGDAMAAPAPAGPHANALAEFNGGAQNGAWSLYIVDDTTLDSGTFNGATLTFFTEPTSAFGGRNPVGCATPDYDGDGRADVAVFRETTGDWFIARSGSNGAVMQAAWGNPSLGDIQVPADYDGDGITDLAVYRQSTGEWFARRSSDLTLYQVAYGAPASTGLGDIPVPSDYDGDGAADHAVYRTTSGQWFIRYSSGKAPAAISWGYPPASDRPARR